ncbi:MAG: hypothetical protein FD119_119 [Stygiobacter sp.]|nr:MAG: hypothetical protein FD119_119 [Stygiobacter sp.]
MPGLFDRGDDATANRILLELGELVKFAFGGEATIIHGHLVRLSSKTLQVDDEVFDYPFHRSATINTTKIDIYPNLKSNTPGGNRVLNFSVTIQDISWSISATVCTQSAPEAKDWLFIGPPFGYCSDRSIALSALTGLSQQAITFSPHP